MVAKEILRDARLHADICLDIPELLARNRPRRRCRGGRPKKLIARGDIRQLAAWVRGAAAVVGFSLHLAHGTRRRTGAQSRRRRNWSTALGNVSFLERPFHPTTLVSVVRTGSRGRAAAI